LEGGTGTLVVGWDLPVWHEVTAAQAARQRMSACFMMGSVDS
jgi:hypothetical protein